MHYTTRLDFQINRLGYKFKNVNLLTEALTHSLDTADNDPHFWQYNRNCQRLQVLGACVLKFIASQYVLRTSDVKQDEGVMTIKAQDLVSVEKQREVGDGILNLVDFRVQDGNWVNPSFRVPYDEFVKALLAAVFLDAGGTDGDGVEAVEKVFLKLWKPYLSKDDTVKELQDCFPVPGPIKAYWERKSIVGFCTTTLQEKLGFEVENKDLLTEAIMHKRFYDEIRNTVEGQLRHPDYQRLEFLGDSVLDLVIAEYVHLKYPSFPRGCLSRKFIAYTNKDFQASVYKGLEIYVPVITISEREEAAVVESIIGAIYVDSDGDFDNLMSSIFQHWKLESLVLDSSLLELESRLGHKFKNEKLLKEALTHESARDKCNESFQYSFQQVYSLGYAGASLLASYYVVRTAQSNATEGALESHHKFLLGSTVSRSIAEEVLEVEARGYAGLADHLVNGVSPFKRFEVFLYSIFGALLLDMGIRMENVDYIFRTTATTAFYRIWNFHLKHCPRKRLEDCFPNSTESQRKMRTDLVCLISEVEFQKLESRMSHKFVNRNLLEQALTTREARKYSTDPNVGDSVRFVFIAKHVVAFVESITQWPNLQNSSNLPILRKGVTDELTCDGGLLSDCAAIPLGPHRLSAYMQKLIIALSMLGAMFVDMQPGDQCLKAVADWIEKLSEANEKRKVKRAKLKKKKEKALKQKSSCAETNYAGSIGTKESSQVIFSSSSQKPSGLVAPLAPVRATTRTTILSPRAVDYECILPESRTVQQNQIPDLNILKSFTSKQQPSALQKSSWTESYETSKTKTPVQRVAPFADSQTVRSRESRVASNFSELHQLYLRNTT